jgi:thioredoxin reductase
LLGYLHEYAVDVVARLMSDPVGDEPTPGEWAGGETAAGVPTIYDVAVIGAGPAGAQAAVSAAHQMRHVLVFNAGPISQRKGRAFWSKSVEIQDVPGLPGATGPKLAHALLTWMAAQRVHPVTIGGRSRMAGIEHRAGVVLRVQRAVPPAGERAPAGYLFRLEASTAPLRPGRPLQIEVARARTLVVASGFEDLWPDIQVDESAERLYQRYRTVLRYAGNRKGWHVCIRCDGHLHVDEHLAIVGTGDVAFDTARGAQDFTDRITVLTNGRPHGMSPTQLAILDARRIPIIEDRIEAHIGQRTDLLGLRLAGGRELYFDGYVVDVGLEPNTHYLRPEDGWAPQRNEDGLLVVDEDGQVLDHDREPIPGLFAAGDIVAGQRNLIATAFGLGQNAGLGASDLLREW